MASFNSCAEKWTQNFPFMALSLGISILTPWILAVIILCILIHWSNVWAEIFQTGWWFNNVSTQGAYQSI